jgi:hypothetical protein
MAFLIIYVGNVCHSQTTKCFPHVWMVKESKPNRIKTAYAFKRKYESRCYCYCYYDFFVSVKNIYNYTLGANRVSVVYNVTLILRLEYVVLVMLFSMIKVLCVYISTFRNMCAVPNMAVLYTSFMSCYVIHVFYKWFGNDCNRLYY